MSVLLLTGKPINWAKPPKATDKVLWSHRDMYGRKVIGSLRTIAHLDQLSALSYAKYGVHVVVIQPPFNTTVAASAGTHDYDACLDLYIPGIDWGEQERFFRANGFACWHRRPPTFGHHIHGFTLPPREGQSINDDFAVAGFTVGKYVDGGHSLYGRQIASSQLGDYYEGRTGLAGHALDPSWFPPNIVSTIFNLDSYIAGQRHMQRLAKRRPLRLAVVDLPQPEGRMAWVAGWHVASSNGAIFGVTGSVHTAQRGVYAALTGLTKDSKQPIAQFGLWKSENPIFWRRKRFRRISARVHPNITEVVLEQRSNKRRVAVLNAGLPSGRGHRRALRALVREHQKAGRAVIVLGTMNTRLPFSMPAGFKWLKGAGLAKIGSTRKGTGGTFAVATDYGHGAKALIRL